MSGHPGEDEEAGSGRSDRFRNMPYPQPQPQPRPPDAAGHPALVVLEWIGQAVGTGVAGNLAYDLIKRFRPPAVLRRGLFRRKRRFCQTDPVIATALAAVIAQCKAHGLPIPDPAYLTASAGAVEEVDGQIVRVVSVTSSFESPFTARVLVPQNEETLQRRGAEVTIHQPITWRVKSRVIRY